VKIYSTEHSNFCQLNKADPKPIYEALALSRNGCGLKYYNIRHGLMVKAISTQTKSVVASAVVSHQTC